MIFLLGTSLVALVAPIVAWTYDSTPADDENNSAGTHQTVDNQSIQYTLVPTPEGSRAQYHERLNQSFGEQ